MISYYMYEGNIPYSGKIFLKYSNTYYWIGARSDNNAWTWIDGTVWEYASWGASQPDLQYTCVHAFNTWFTVDCTGRYPYICSYDNTVGKFCV